MGFFTNDKVKSTINDITKSFSANIQATEMKAVQAGSMQNEMTIKGLKGCTIKNVTQEGTFKADLKSMQKVLQKGMTEDDIKTTTKQEVEKVRQNISFNAFSSSDVESLTNSIKVIGTEINQSIKTTCAQAVASGNSLTIEDCKDSEILNINQEVVTNLIMDCYQETSQHSEAKKKLETLLASKLRDVEENGLFAVLMAVAVIIFLVIVAKVMIIMAPGLMAGGAMSGMLKSPMFWMLVLTFFMMVWLYLWGNRCFGDKKKQWGWCRKSSGKKWGFFTLSVVLYGAIMFAIYKVLSK
jgi:hypothetical protein